MADDFAGETPWSDQVGDQVPLAPVLPEPPTADTSGSVADLPRSQPVEVEVTMTSESQFFAGLTGDVATGGVFVQTYETRPVGSRLVLAIVIEDDEILATGVVRWIRPAGEGAPPGLGVVLEHLSQAQRAVIDAFCRARPALYHELEPV